MVSRVMLLALKAPRALLAVSKVQVMRPPAKMTSALPRSQGVALALMEPTEPATVLSVAPPAPKNAASYWPMR